MPTTTVAETPTARHGKARLALVINWQVYALRRVRRDHWALTRRGGDGDGLAYLTGRTEGGFYCTCPDHLYRGRTIRCKHVGALLAARLLSHPRAGKGAGNG